MGDILHALPAVTGLRQAHPGWVIDWVVEPAWCPLLSSDCDPGGSPRGPAQPLIDHIHLAPAKAWGRPPFGRTTRHEIRELGRRLRAQQYDAVLDLQGAVRSAAMGRISGCRRRIGESKPREWAAQLAVYGDASRPAART